MRKQRYKQEKEEEGGREGVEEGRGSVAVSLLHITVSKRLKASLFSKESQNVSSVGRERQHTHSKGGFNHVQGGTDTF